MKIYGSTTKKYWQTYLVLILYLNINEEAYWNYFHMSLQIEDAFDVLSVKLPNHIFLMLMDQSLRHRKGMEGGSHPKIWNTTINKLGTYQSHLKMCDIKSLTFAFIDVWSSFLLDEESDEKNSIHFQEKRW